jgi:hypothetical protein
MRFDHDVRAKWQHHSALALPYRLRFLLRFAAAWPAAYASAREFRMDQTATS